MFTGKSIVCDDITDIDELFAKYTCLLCPTGPEEKMVWICATHSETLDLHPGFTDFLTACDLVILHMDRIAQTMTYVTEHTLPNGTELKPFIRTGNGVLSCRLLQRPGTHAFLIPGLSQHSDLYKLENAGSWSEWNTLNTRYSGLRAMVYSTILILNPKQVNCLQQGKMSFDLDPKVLSSWFIPFVNSWSQFVDRNPNIVINRE